MIYDVEKRIAKLRNEIKAQKVNSGMVYSQLLMPSNIPQATYSGVASWTGSTTSPVARLRFRFKRTDGLVTPPLINFSHSSSCSPTYKEYALANGFSFTPDINMSYLDSDIIEGYIAEVGDSYVDYYVDFSSSIISRYHSISSIQISASCQAIANVYGTLEVERLK